MIVYFSGSTRNILKDIDVYRKIISTIRELNSAINNDWVETAWARAKKAAEADTLPYAGNIVGTVQDVENSLHAADVLVAEGSNGSAFGVGYEVATAIRLKKPVLVLVDKCQAGESYATGLSDPLITCRQYTASDLRQHIEEFIVNNSISNKDLRFNFVIDRHLYNHIRWKSFRSTKTKAEVVRRLIIEDMKRESA